jgi:hypothetical protein
MKPAILLAAAGLISLGIVGTTPAAAWHLSPPGKFTGDGKTSATKNGISLPCIAHFTGLVNKRGIGYVTGGSFKDDGKIGCATVSLQGLPWKAVATTCCKVVIHNVTFHSTIGDCGPGNLPVHASGGVISFKAVPLPGGCTVTGKITTSPTVSIVAN